MRPRNVFPEGDLTMWNFSSLLAPKRRVHRARDCRFQPRMEALEDRCCPSGTSSFEWADPTGGALDPTFGSGGQVLSSFSNNEDVANAVTIQPDGKAVIAGYTKAAVSNTFADFLVARYNADGSLDSSFGTGGRTITDFQSDTDQAHAVALQPQA